VKTSDVIAADLSIRKCVIKYENAIFCSPALSSYRFDINHLMFTFPLLYDVFLLGVVASQTATLSKILTQYEY